MTVLRTVSGILVASMSFTYITSAWTQQPSKISTETVGRLLEWQAWKQGQWDLTEQKQHLYESKTFNFMGLPPEIILDILGYCDNNTYLSLVRVSHRVQEMTYSACISHMPVVLTKPQQVHSFSALLRACPWVNVHVRHIWAMPDRADSRTCVEILRKCTRVKWLACDARMLQEAIGSWGQFCHNDCRVLTMLPSSEKRWSYLMDGVHVGTLFRQLTQLRVYGNLVPQRIYFSNLTHLAYHDNRVPSNLELAERSLGDKVLFPVLHTTILTKRRGYGGGGMRMSRTPNTNIFTFEIPERWTELEMWCDNTKGRGMWDICGDFNQRKKRNM